MMDKYQCDRIEMAKIREKLKEIQIETEAAYNQAARVKGKIESDGYWRAMTQQTMCAYLDLVTQYHKDLVKGGERIEAPIKKAVEHMQKLDNHMKEFCKEWEEYQQLGGIK